MPVTAVPSIDQTAAAGWTEQDRSLYRALPYFIAKVQVERRKTWTSFSKLVKKRKWKANQGDTMKVIRTNPSPHLRQFAYPNVMSAVPKKDVVDIRETETDANVYRHRFESPVFNFYPDFTNFMSHINDHSQDIMEKIERYEDIFIRTNMWHMSPYVFIVKDNGTVERFATTPWDGIGTFDQTNDGKTPATVREIAARTTGHLSLTALYHAVMQMETDLGVPFFSGSDLPSEDQGLAGKYLLMTSSEAYHNFLFDPFLLQHKNCDMDIIHNTFRGSLFGRTTAQIESMSMRFAWEADNDATWHEPELRVDDGVTLNDGETVPNENYTNPATSQYEVGFLCGKNGYESIEVGPPPSQFTGNSMPHNFPAMFWNGEVKLTKRFLVQTVDSDTGDTAYEENTYGEHLKFISQIALGIIPLQRRNVIPIIYKRKRGQ
jgi:hypothetical protein